MFGWNRRKLVHYVESLRNVTSVFDDRLFVRGIGFVAVSVAVFWAVAWTLGIEPTRAVREQVYVATGAGVGLSFARGPVRRLLRGGGRGTEFVVEHADYRGLLVRFAVFWLLGYVGLSVAAGGSVDLLEARNAVVAVFAFVLALAAVRYPSAEPALRDAAWILAAVWSAAVAVFVLYTVVESFVAQGFRRPSVSTTVGLLAPAVAAAVAVGAIQVALRGVFGPTTRELEHERFPATMSVSSDADEQFLRAVDRLAGIWVDRGAASVRYDPASAKVTVSVDGDEQATYTTEPDDLEVNGGYSRLADEVGDEDEKWRHRGQRPRYPEGVETRKYLQVKVVTDVPEASIRDRLALRLQAVRRTLGSLLR